MTQPAQSTSNPLLQLWRNQESRGVIIQIVTMVVVFALLAAIARNVVINLEAVGKEFSFGFLLWAVFSPRVAFSVVFSHLEGQ